MSKNDTTIENSGFCMCWTGGEFMGLGPSIKITSFPLPFAPEMLNDILKNGLKLSCDTSVVLINIMGPNWVCSILHIETCRR